MRPSAMPRSRRRRRTRSTCRRTSSRASATGRNRSRSNTASARAAKAGKEFDDQLHAMDYMVYAYLQLGAGREGAGRRRRDECGHGHQSGRFAGPYALAVSPARYAVERGDWKGAAELQVRPSKFAYVEAMTHFARALGAARSGNPDAAKADIAKLAELRDKLRAGQGRLLGGAGRHPVAGRDRLGALCRGQARRRAQGHERRRRCRGQDREAPGDAGRADAGARTLRRDAARARHGARRRSPHSRRR